MASYTSIKSGDFNDPFTWTVGGTAWPSASGDTFTVSAGHNVRINGEFTHQLGASTVNGTLYVDHLANTEIRFSNVWLTVNGALKLCGLNNEPVSSAYTCSIGFNTTSDTGQGILLNSNTSSIVTSGANDYVGNPRAVMKTTWSSGQSFTISGDYTQGANIWRVGQKICVHRYANGYSAFTTDVRLLTIASLALSGSDTVVTISEAFPTTMNAGGYVVNMSRNVKIFKVGYLEGGGVYNSARWRIQGNAAGAELIQLNSTECIGLYGITCRTIDKTQNFAYNTVFRNSAYVLAGIGNGVCNFTLNFCYIFSISNQISGNFIYINDCMAFGISSLTSYCSDVYFNRLICYSFNNLFTLSSNTYIYDSEFFCGNYVSYLASNCKYYRCWFGFNKGSQAILNGEGYFNFGFGFDTEHIYINCKHRYDYINALNKNSSYGNSGIVGSLCSVNHNDIDGTHMRYEMFGEVLKNSSVSAVKPSSSSTAEVITYSNCNQYVGIKILEWKEHNVASIPQTRKISLLGTGWSSFPTSSDLYVEVISVSANGYTPVYTYSTTTLSANSVWTDFILNFTPGYTGTVIYKLYIKKYVAASKIYVDEFLQRPGFNPKRASWSEAKLKLEFDYNDWQNPESWS